jgi:hypothetical protein
MQSTGQEDTQAAHLTPTQGCVITYDTVSLPFSLFSMINDHWSFWLKTILSLYIAPFKHGFKDLPAEALLL